MEFYRDELPTALPTDLNTAIFNGDFQAVKNLIETQGYSPNYTGLFGLAHTPLYVAAHRSEPEIVDYLIEKGADVNAKGRWGYDYTPFTIAHFLGNHSCMPFFSCFDLLRNMPVVYSLLAANAQITNHYQDSLDNNEKTEIVTEYLIRAVSTNDTYSIAKILKNDYADVNAKHKVISHYSNYTDIAFITPLEAAVEANHFESTALLLEKGATILAYSPDTWKTHPLNLATDTQIIELLIKHTPELSKCLFGAIMSGKEELITLLVKNGADIEYSLQCEDFGDGTFTPLEFAVMRDDATMIKSLVENGANISAESSFHASGTPLELAAAFGKLQALASLIELGSDLTHQNENGETAFDLAMKAGPIIPALNILFNVENAKHPNDTSAVLNEEKTVEIDSTFTNDQIMPSVVSEDYVLQDTNSTISDNSPSVENFSQPKNGTLLISIELNEVLTDEQMIMPADQALQEVQAIELKIDNNDTTADNQTETLYIQPMNIPLDSIIHEQLLLG